MKSNLIDVSEKPQKYYPALFKKDGVVVLFETDGCGTVLVGNEVFTVGMYSETFYTQEWQRLPSGSQVVLTQD